MRECIICEGEEWGKCKNHMNSIGGHGEYKCIYFVASTNLGRPFSFFGYCNMTDILKDEDFEI